MNKNQNFYSFCVPSIRPDEAAETVRQFDKNFSQFGHSVPFFVFLDNPSGKIADEELAPIRQVAKDASNDVFMLSESDRDAFNQRIITLFKNTPKGKNIDPVLLGTMLGKAWGRGCGALLYTTGHRMILCEDDVRPYQLHQSDSNINIADDPNILWAGREINVDKPAYHVLKEIGNSDYSTASLPSSCKLTVSDVAGHFFTPLDQSASSMTSILKAGEDVVTAMTNRWSNRSVYINVEPGSYPAIGGMPDSKRYPPIIDGQDVNESLSLLEGSISNAQGVRPDPFYVKAIGKPKKENGTVKFVVPRIGGGVPDYGTPTFLEYVIKHPEIEDRFDIRTLLVTTNISKSLALLDQDFTISGQFASIVNDGTMGPNFFVNLRMDDLGIRLDSLKDEVLTARAPVSFTHVQAPEGRNTSLGAVVYQETLGQYAKPLLFNGRNPDGTFNINMDEFNHDVADSIITKVKGYYDAIQTQLGGELTTGRRACLQQIAQDLDTHFEHFDVNAFQHKAQAELKEKINAYVVARDIWPDLQKIVIQNRDKLMLTNMKTGDKVSMASIMRDQKYSRDFTASYKEGKLNNSAKSTKLPNQSISHLRS